MNLVPTDLIAFLLVAVAAWKVGGAIRAWLRALTAPVNAKCGGCTQCSAGKRAGDRPGPGGCS